MTETSGNAPKTRDDAEQDPILKRLQQVYNDVADEPLPDRLLDLLSKLDEAERNR